MCRVGEKMRYDDSPCPGTPRQAPALLFMQFKACPTYHQDMPTDFRYTRIDMEAIFLRTYAKKASILKSITISYRTHS